MSNAHVLVAEDNDMNYDLMEFLLEELEVSVSRAVSGSQALAAACAERPNLVVMDIQLPGMDGLAVMQSLRANPATHDLPIVVVSALAMTGDRERAMAVGCDAYITKPVSPDHFQEVVRGFLHGTGRSGRA